MADFRQTIPSALLALLALAQCTATESRPDHPHGETRVQLMTSLPLVWGEGASMESILSGEAEPAPIFRYWQGQYDIAAVDSLENLADQKPDIVILAQPRAMAPADLADLDAWVRAGGTAIILTDPDLVWPSALPLGDPRRPLASGLLSPLLGHWGLELVTDAESSTDIVKLRFGKYGFATRGVGRLEPIAAAPSSDVRCDTDKGRAFLRCKIGQGQAAIVADADFLNAALWSENARRSPQKSDAVRFLDSLMQDRFQPDDGKR